MTKQDKRSIPLFNMTSSSIEHQYVFLFKALLKKPVSKNMTQTRIVEI